jgi:2-isopropylmalate synthase
MNVKRYRPIPPVKLAQRSWPDRVLTSAPRWCSVDLRDGNQALIEPMGKDRKLKFFETLVKIGFREIEVGFPSASQTDFDFVRMLIDGNRIPENVTIQVLTQAREHLIARTFEAIQGAKRAIVHLYNSTSELQRRVVFGLDKPAILQMALQGTEWVKQHAKTVSGTDLTFEYSPESFTGTEVEYAAEVSDAVAQAWGATPQKKMILNLPATVEMSSPNIYADQIEWMHKNLKHRDKVVLSLHTHNDRGCAVAAAELGLLAGAERVEGTLFGNGERTGNVDLVTVALNLFAQGVDPGLDLRDLPGLVEIFEYCNRLPVPARHPYSGELVFTAFSGSHQDAIKKGLEALEREKNPRWEVPYLPIDPSDVGRKYEPLVRINSQSGKGGVAFVLERTHGYVVPKGLAIEFSQAVQRITDATGEELSPSAVFETFDREYLKPGRYTLADFDVHREGKDACRLQASVLDAGKRVEITSKGNGPIDAFVRGLRDKLGSDVHVVDYNEHALDNGESAEAVAYVQLRHVDGRTTFGVGRDDDIVAASLRAVLGGMNRLESVPPLRMRSTPP